MGSRCGERSWSSRPDPGVAIAGCTEAMVVPPTSPETHGKLDLQVIEMR